MSGRGNFVRVAHASPTKNFGGEMLTARELTKPKSTFAASKIFVDDDRTLKAGVDIHFVDYVDKYGTSYSSHT